MPPNNYQISPSNNVTLPTEWLTKCNHRLPLRLAGSSALPAPTPPYLLSALKAPALGQRRRTAAPLSCYFNAPKTFWSISVVRATGFCRICCSSVATILNSPSMALLVT